MSNLITVLIHGTFANKEFDGEGSPVDAWWKLTDDPDRTTADRLQAALAGSDSGDVWAPTEQDLAVGSGYKKLVEWNGENKHRDRKVAGASLARELGVLAAGRNCTPAEPLEVNFVAHSHGGNVVLEALGQLPPNVEPRTVSLLGTPILWRYTDPRILYLSLIMFFVSAWFAVTWQQIRDPSNEAGDIDLEAIESWPEFIITELILGIVLFWICAGLILGLRLVFQKILPSRPTYGPRPEELSAIMKGRPVDLFISEEDEANLMMRLGAAPMKAYRALLANRPKLGAGVHPIKKVLFFPLRIIERTLILPVVYVALAPLLELMLERFGLGFPLHSVAVRNYEMINWVESDPYGNAIRNHSIDADELQMDAAKTRLAMRETYGVVEGTPSEGAPAEGTSTQGLSSVEQLRETLLDAYGSLKAQVHLSHSDYYDSQWIIEDNVAVAITTPETVGQPSTF